MPKPRAHPSAMPARAAHAPQQVRIIGGQWRRTRLPVPDRPGLRPTPDRVRETLFNWLGQSLNSWQVIDAFAGSGALGLEAASRGASQVLLVEQDATLAASLRAQVQKLQAAAIVTVLHGDGLAALRAQPAGQIDLALLDPPFTLYKPDSPAPGTNLFASALAAAAQAVRPGGFIYLEAPSPWPAHTPAAAGLHLHRQLRTGAVCAHLWLRQAENDQYPAE